MAYILEFTIKGLPKRVNQSFATSWRARMAESRKWKGLVFIAANSKRPPKPLKKAKLELIRHSSQEPDFDGLCSSFKHIIDGLIHAEVIENDKMSNIGQPSYKWIKAPIREGKIQVIVTEDEANEIRTS